MSQIRQLENHLLKSIMDSILEMDYLLKLKSLKLNLFDSWIDNLNLIHLGIEIALNEAAAKWSLLIQHRRDHNLKVGDLVLAFLFRIWILNVRLRN